MEGLFSPLERFSKDFYLFSTWNFAFSSFNIILGKNKLYNYGNLQATKTYWCSSAYVGHWKKKQGRWIVCVTIFVIMYLKSVSGTFWLYWMKNDFISLFSFMSFHSTKIAQKGKRFHEKNDLCLKKLTPFLLLLLLLLLLRQVPTFW